MGRPKGVTVCHPGREHVALGLCWQCYIKQYRVGKDRSLENHTIKAKARRKKWQEDNREKVRACVRAGHIFRNFGITEEKYDEKLLSQKNICALCGKEFYGEYLGGGDPVLDHSHNGEKLRDFIHRLCNTALGQFMDDPKTCRLAAEYLERHGEINGISE